MHNRGRAQRRIDAKKFSKVDSGERTTMINPIISAKDHIRQSILDAETESADDSCLLDEFIEVGGELVRWDDFLENEEAWKSGLREVV